jgi:hypothetical protein
MSKTQVNVRMSDELIAALKEQATNEGVSFSELVIRYCKHGLAIKPDSLCIAEANYSIANELYRLKERMDALEKSLA